MSASLEKTSGNGLDSTLDVVVVGRTFFAGEVAAHIERELNSRSGDLRFLVRTFDPEILSKRALVNEPLGKMMIAVYSDGDELHGEGSLHNLIRSRQAHAFPTIVVNDPNSIKAANLPLWVREIGVMAIPIPMETEAQSTALAKIVDSIEFFLLPDVSLNKEEVTRRARAAVKARAQHKEPPEPSPAPPEPAIRALIQMLDDGRLANEQDDRLGFGVYADALAALIDNPRTGTPLTLAINAPWGAGKSSLAWLIKKKLEDKPAAAGSDPHVCFWFNAWMHDEAEHLTAAFMAEIARALDRERSWWARLVRPLPTALCDPLARAKRNRRWIILTLLVALGILVYTGVITPETFTGLFEKTLNQSSDQPPNKTAKDAVQTGGLIFSLLTSLGLLAKLWTVASSTAKSISAFVRDPKTEAGAGHIYRVREQIKELMDDAIPEGSRFVIFVDDLERCRPPSPVDLLEVVNQIFDDTRVVTVIVADLPAVAACAEIKYENLADKYDPAAGIFSPDKNSGRTYGRLYLQKLVQLQFDLPRQTTESMERLLASLSAETAARADEERDTEPAPRPVVVPAISEIPHQALLPTRSYRSKFRQVWRDGRGWAAGAWRTLRLIFRLPLLAASQLGACIGHPHWSRVNAMPVEILTPVPASVRIGTQTSWASIWLLIAAGLSCLLFLLVRIVGVVKYDPPLPNWLSSMQFNPFEKLSPLFYAGGLGLGFGLVLLTLGMVRAVRRYRRAEAKAILEYRESLKRSQDMPDTIPVPKALSPIRIETLRRESQQLRLMNDSELLEKAFAEAKGFLPPMPRNAKRMLNRLRLLLFITFETGLLGQPEGVQPEQVGRWIVLQERWPELAQHLFRNPDDMEKLEKARAKTVETFRHTVAGLDGVPDSDHELERFFHHRATFGNGFKNIVRFRLGETETAE